MFAPTGANTLIVVLLDENTGFFTRFVQPLRRTGVRALGANTLIVVLLDENTGFTTSFVQPLRRTGVRAYRREHPYTCFWMNILDFSPVLYSPYGERVFAPVGANTLLYARLDENTGFITSFVQPLRRAGVRALGANTLLYVLLDENTGFITSFVQPLRRTGVRA